MSDGFYIYGAGMIGGQVVVFVGVWLYHEYRKSAGVALLAIGVLMVLATTAAALMGAL